MIVNSRLTTLAGAAGLALTLAACSGGGNSSAPPAITVTTVAGAVATTSAGPATTVTTSTTAVAAAKANANTASQADIQAALTAAGVPNASRWAVEVVEYRPYPTNDPNLANLRQNLAKYNPGADVVDKIVSALSL